MKRLILGIIVFCSMLAVATVSYAIHEQNPAESKPSEGTGTTLVVPRGASADATTLQALINLLEKKGLITKEELRKETDRLKSGR
jgi:hypothetical protein